MRFANAPLAQKLGLALSRAVVPAWVLAGAVFKLVERTPNNLPSRIVGAARELQVDLGVLLRTLIGLEFLAAALMIFVARLARPVAILMLGCFCLILVGELLAGSGSCGCFGAVTFHPALMLAIDASLLAGVVCLRPPAPLRAPRRPLAAAALAIAGGFAAAFGVPDRALPSPPEPPDGTTLGPPPPCPPFKEGFWYAKDIESWPGRSWQELELCGIIGMPPRIAQGRVHVVLYRRDCDHCEEMFQDHFAGRITAPVLAMRIPSEVTWQMPPTQGVTFTDLPGDEGFWVVQTPLVITLQDGTVLCATEGEEFLGCLESPGVTVPGGGDGPP
jgi:hypothetical protein